MGASSIMFELDGKKTRREVKQAFRDRQEADRCNNGCREGYSGDFQTVDKVIIHDKLFKNEEEAYEYCMDNAQKWSHVVAVKYTDTSKLNKSKKIKTLEERHTKLSLKLIDTRTNINNKLKHAKSKTISCKKCESKINRRFLNSGACPLCKNSLLSETDKTRLNRLSKNICELENKIRAQKTLEASKKSLPKKWLIAGWGAC